MITSKERAFLRSLANKIDSTVQIGKGGINENMIALVEDILEKARSKAEAPFKPLSKKCHLRYCNIFRAKNQDLYTIFLLFMTFLFIRAKNSLSGIKKQKISVEINLKLCYN